MPRLAGVQLKVGSQLTKLTTPVFRIVGSGLEGLSRVVLVLAKPG